tara:strand:- start:1444 stop:1932 length:489 start_codon:yes stop_codon:yes gene_type:complete
MPFYVKEARSFISHATNTPRVEVKYSRYKEGEGYVNEAACFDAVPIGSWKEIQFAHGSTSFQEFLETMVVNTIDVVRYTALIILEDSICENRKVRSIIRIVNSIKIIDPTFTPPRINKKCSWQINYLKCFCKETFPAVIRACENRVRLEKLFIVLKMITEEL